MPDARQESVPVITLCERSAGFGQKSCLQDGSWFKHPDSNKTWSNYTTCVDLDDLKVGTQVFFFFISYPTTTTINTDQWRHEDFQRSRANCWRVILLQGQFTIMVFLKLRFRWVHVRPLRVGRKKPPPFP